MTQKLVRSVGGQMCTTNFKFRPNSIIYPLTVFFHSRPFLQITTELLVIPFHTHLLETPIKNCGYIFFGICVVDFKKQCFEVTKFQVTLHETRSAFSALQVFLLVQYFCLICTYIICLISYLTNDVVFTQQFGHNFAKSSSFHHQFNLRTADYMCTEQSKGIYTLCSR